jgi:hypothetical protein
MSPSAIAAKMFEIWRVALDKLEPTEKVVLELAIQEGGIIKAIDKWLEVESLIFQGDLNPDQRLRALFGDKVPDLVETILYQEKTDEQ